MPVILDPARVEARRSTIFPAVEDVCTPDIDLRAEKRDGNLAFKHKDGTLTA